MSNILFLYDNETPLVKDIKASGFKHMLYTDYQSEAFDIIFDFTTQERKEKLNLYQTLKTNQVVADLTCCDTYEFFDTEPKIKASFSALFLTETRTIEINIKDNLELDSYFEKLDIKLCPIQETGVGLIYARTFAQIVNEAYFALEEKVATKEDIDRAMKYGVNYPFGPFEWSKGKEKFVIRILNELKNKYQGKRYEIAPLLLSSDKNKTTF